MGRGGLVVLGLLCAVGAAPDADAETVELRIATLAPRGSSWANTMEKGARKVAARTQGRVKVKHFFAGQLGDEREMIRKMSVGELDGAALTAVGLGLINGDVRVLELPFLFANERQVSYVRARVEGELARRLEQAGYVVIAWAGLGWVHLYTNLKVQSRQDLGRTRMWAWSDDTIVLAMFKRLGLTVAKLGVPEVLSSLQSGRIDACYTVPVAAVALQWFTKVKYATKVPISYSIGAYVIRKDVFDALAPADRATLKRAGDAIGQELSRNAIRDNQRAKQAMVAAGIQFVPSPAAMVSDFQKEGQAVWPELADSLYHKAILDAVLRYRAEAIARYP